MERFIEQWKQQQLDRYNYITNGRHSFKAAATQQSNNNLLHRNPNENAVQRLTLVDGTVIITGEGDWTGKPITLEDGTHLPPGEYILASGPLSNGGVIVIGKDGNVKELRELQDRGIKNRHAPLYEGQITLEEFKRIEFAKLPQNRQLRKQAIDQLSKKVEELRKSVRPEPPKPIKSFGLDNWNLKRS